MTPIHTNRKELVPIREMSVKDLYDCDRIKTATAFAGLVAHAAAHIGQLCPHAQPAGRTEAAHGLPKREVPEPLGMLEQGHGDVHDCR